MVLGKIPSGTRSLTSNGAIPRNQWSHITIRYDRNLSNQRQAIFINGQLDSSDNISGSLRTNNLPLQIAQDQNYPGRAFDGFIDEVQIFSQALSNAQILQLYRQRHPCSSGPTLQCFSDSFDSSLSDLWVTSTSKGVFSQAWSMAVCALPKRLAINQRHQATNAFSLHATILLKSSLITLLMMVQVLMASRWYFPTRESHRERGFWWPAGLWF